MVGEGQEGTTIAVYELSSTSSFRLLIPFILPFLVLFLPPVLFSFSFWESFFFPYFIFRGYGGFVVAVRLDQKIGS
jgi:hypothetical protein